MGMSHKGLPMLRILFFIALAATVVTVATRMRAAAREARAEQDFPPEGRFVEIDGARVHAVVRGAGPDVVLIHGASGNTRDMTFALADTLTDRYRVIVFDRPGLGHSDRLDGDEGLAAQATRLQRAATALGAERPIVLGQSYGGSVALAWALDHPESLSALITVSAPTHPWEGGLPMLYRVNSSALGSALAVPLITAWVPRGYVRDQIAGIFPPQEMPEGYAAHIGAPLTLRRESLRANANQRATLKAEIAAMAPRYGEIAVPLEILHGTADDTVPFDIHAAPLAQAAPTAALTDLPGIGHVPQNVVPEAVAAAVDRAAARIDR